MYQPVKTGFLFLLVLLLVACDPDPIDPGGEGEEGRVASGTLVVDFTLTHPWLPVSRIIRTDLHVARTAYDMYRGIYIQSANLLDSQNYYTFYLGPGNYYLEAGIACICGGDSCSAAGFPGNQWGQKFTSYTFTIEQDKTTKVTIQFLR